MDKGTILSDHFLGYEMKNDQLFSYQYQGSGNITVQPSDYLLSLSRQDQREKLLNAIETYHNEIVGIKDSVQQARLMLFIEFAQHLLSTQNDWSK
jgi:hypothetical protein